MSFSQKKEESMKGRRRRRGLHPADFMMCFPTKAHLKLLPKPICSPSRPANSDQRGLPSRPSPLFKVGPLIEQSKSREGRKGLSLMPSSEEVEVREPTSPKVTCAGQIKVRYGTSEKGKGRMRKRRPNWIEALGLKKDFFDLLAAFRGLRFKIGCFGSFHGSVMDDSTTLDDDEEEEEEDIEGQEEEEEAAYELSKWFMGLEEEKRMKKTEEEEEEEVHGSIPPPNALLLMRCRSAPANGLSRRQDDRGGGTETMAEKESKEGEKEEEKESLVFMSYPPDFLKLSSDIVKETWVVGNNDSLMMRCRSWKR